MVRIWNQKVNRENDTHIPVIIPLVIYHGKTKWKIGAMLSDLIMDFETLPEEVKQLTPDYRYLIYDLSQFSDEDIKGNAELTIALSIFRDIFKKNSQEFLETIFKAARALDELEEKETGLQYFETCMRYILSSGPQLSRDQLNTVIKQLEVTYKKGSEVTMTLAEVLRTEGKIEGIEEGEVRAYSKMAIKALSKKFGILPTEYREKLAQLDLITLETLHEEIDNFKSIEDVKKFLGL
ncbi:MAG: Rpn family recombination-promoting nuclease/putative transposase [Acetobacterium sp.]|nr:Rpn family recombination-promoting nuclease/putative transposase [Acetobacterium sp.]MDO9490955.1 Rpn family recombination-promoting nuclease/putative transposase [Acetobacterium sp.]